MKLRTKQVEKWIKKEVDGGIAEFLVCPMTPKESSEALERATTYKWEKNQRFENLDFYKFKMDRINRVIKDWKGVEDEDGKPIECNKLNREMVYTFNRDLIDSVLDDSDKIMEQEVKNVEESLKN